MSIKVDLTFDCVDARVMADFWKSALGYVDEPPPAPFTTRKEWLAHFGDPGDQVDDGAWLCDPDGVGTRLSILKVPEPKVAKNRLHIDVRVPVTGTADQRWVQLKAKAEELVRLGGRMLTEFDGHHLVMCDPEGNEFCVAAAKVG